MKMLSYARMKGRLGLLITLFLGKIVSLLPTPAAPSGVLIVRLDAIGDFILWQRSAIALRSLYPGQNLVLAANSLWAPIAKQLPYWDEVMPIEVTRLQTNFSYRVRTLVAVRARKFATVFQPTYSRALLTGDLLVRASGATVRTGVDGDLTCISSLHKKISDKWYTQLVQAGSPAGTEIEHNHEILRGVGWNQNTTPFDILPTVAKLGSSLQFDQPYLIIFPGASWSGRQWPVQNFVRLIELIGQAHADWLAVLCGSAQEVSLCGEIAARSQRRVVNLAGKTLMPEFCELVRKARFLIGNETSAVHIASAVDTPSVCLLGGGHFGRFVPYPPTVMVRKPEPVYERMACFNYNWNCHIPHVQGEAVPCIARISVEEAYNAIERVVPSH